MYKSTITFKNGSTIQLECETADQLAELLLKYETGIIHTALATPDIHLSVSQARPRTKTARYKGRQSQSHFGWTDKDILTIARKLINGEHRNTVIKYIAQNSNPNHTLKAAYITVNRIARYLSRGDTNTSSQSGISAGMVATLKRNNILPSSYTVSSAADRTRNYIPSCWSDRDLCEVALIVRDNINTERLADMVGKYIKNDSDNKKRPIGTVVTTTSDLRTYFRTGDTRRLSRRMLTLFKKHGLDRIEDKVLQGTPVHITKIHTAPEEA